MMASEKTPTSAEASSNSTESIYSSLPKLEKQRLEQYLGLWLAQVQRWKHAYQPQTHYEVTPIDSVRSPITVQKYSYYNDINQQTVITLVAFDEHQNILGVRKTSLSKNSDQQRLEASGDIEVLARKQGIASILESIHSLVIQEYINNQSDVQTLRYTIDDANERRLADKQSELGRSTSESKIAELKDAITEAESQRQSWLKLYGVDGKLGFIQEQHRLIKDYQKGNIIVNQDYTVIQNDETIDLELSIKKTLSKIEAS